MWSFAVGLFYIKLYPDSLRLAAIYGFSASVAIILFGAPIGRWVDKTARLKGEPASMFFSFDFPKRYETTKRENHSKSCPEWYPAGGCAVIQRDGP